jgi:hypothetical protein
MASAAVYDEAVARFAEGGLDWENDEVRVMLLTGSYVPQQGQHTDRSDVARFEVASSGTYQRGGSVLPDRVVERDRSGRVQLLAGGVEFRDFTGEFRYAVTVQEGGLLVGFTDFGDQSARNASVSIEYTDGVCDFDVVRASERVA